MNNQEIYDAAYCLLKPFLWKKPQSITEEEQRRAYDTLLVVMTLFEKVKVNRCDNDRLRYLNCCRLQSVDHELNEKCWHNACHELRDFLRYEFYFEKHMLTDMVFMLKKHLIDENAATEAIVEYVLSISRDEMKAKRKMSNYEMFKYERAKCILEWFDSYGNCFVFLISLCVVIIFVLTGLNFLLIKQQLLLYIMSIISSLLMLCAISALGVLIFALRFVERYGKRM